MLRNLQTATQTFFPDHLTGKRYAAEYQLRVLIRLRRPLFLHDKHRITETDGSVNCNGRTVKQDVHNGLEACYNQTVFGRREEKTMTVLQQLNSGGVYLICGSIVAFIAVVCVIFLIRAWRAGRALGMDTARMKRAVTASATFSVLPSVGILLGVLALSGKLGVPWPWLRLSVIGALHYETQVADAAAEQLGGQVTAQSFPTIALLMSICIMWGMILSALFNRRYLGRLQKGGKLEKQEGVSGSGFGDRAMAAMFIGMVSAYIGSYVGGFASGNGLLTFSGSWTPLAVALASALAMAVFTYFSEKKGMVWLENFSIAGSMLFGMLAAVLIGK